MKKIFNVSSKYNTMAAVIGGGLLAILLIGGLLLRPAWTHLKTLGQEIPVERQQRDLKKQDYENLEKAKKFLDENQPTVEQINTAVPIQPEVPSILVTLESLAKQNGVFMTSFTPQQIGVTGQAQPSSGGSTGSTGASGGAAASLAAPTGVDSIEITANFRGQYSALINFLYNLERSLRIVDVKTITVSSTSGVLEGNISFRAYYKQVEGGPKPTVTQGGTTGASPAPAAGGTK